MKWKTETWKVIEEDPFPDDYIAVFAPKWPVEILRSYSEFKKWEDAKSRSVNLAKAFKLHKISVFHPDGNRETISLKRRSKHKA